MFRPLSQVEYAAQRLKGRKRRLPKALVPKAPVALERSYARELKRYLEVIFKAVDLLLLPRLEKIFNEQNASRPTRFDSPGDDITKLMQDIEIMVERDYSESEIRALARRKGYEVAAYSEIVAAKGLKRVLGVDLLGANTFTPAEVSLFVSDNAKLIKSMRVEGLNKVEGLVFKGLRSGGRWEDISKEIVNYVHPERGTIRSRANLIARDQVSKLNGNLNKLRQNEMGVKRYVWRTMNDEAVRDSHAANNGNTYSWDEPPSTGHPGEDFQCRCQAEPVLSDLIPGLDESDT